MSGNAPEDVGSIRLTPGQPIRPKLSEGEARQLVEKLYGVKIKSISEENSYDDKNYMVQLEPEWRNPHIKELWPHGYMFKVLNSMDSQKKQVGQCQKLLILFDMTNVSEPLHFIILRKKSIFIETVCKTLTH